MSKKHGFSVEVLLHVLVFGSFLAIEVQSSLDGSRSTDSDTENNSGFTELWAVHVPGGEPHARSVAEQYGFKYVRQLRGHDEHFLYEKRGHPSRSTRSSEHHTTRLMTDDRVQWAEQQKEQIRQKRGSITKQYKLTRDTLANKQWYLLDQQSNDENKVFRTTEPKPISLDVKAVWDMGYTGKGITVTVMDDGLEKDHTDLRRNFSPNASYDLNDRDDDPSPRYDPTNENKHGTRCAGEIAMQANNGKCGVGVAFNANIGGVRMLDGTVTDSLEAEAFGIGSPNVDIMSASWGPNDDGKTIEGPGTLAYKALEKGVTTGRNGLGTIYVWASGNGGGNGDNCDCDGYTGSIYTLSISSASQHCKSPWYSEKCASTLATTYSSGEFGDDQITTTDLHDECTTKHTGTSASAPLGAGVLALVLEANSNLNWRDVQWVVMYTANYEALAGNPGWKMNGAGIMVNSRFGAGLLDGKAMVDMVIEKDFTSVPEKNICTVDVASVEPGLLPLEFCSGEEIVIKFETTGCEGQDNEIRYLEHVQLYVDIDFGRRGDVSIYMKSPEGDEPTMMLSEREKDNSSAGIRKWPFMSTHQWSENPAGKWIVTIRAKESDESYCGAVNSVKLVLHGLQEKPWIMEKFAPRKYDEASIAEDEALCKERGKQHSEKPTSETERRNLYFEILYDAITRR